MGTCSLTSAWGESLWALVASLVPGGSPCAAHIDMTGVGTCNLTSAWGESLCSTHTDMTGVGTFRCPPKI